MMLNKQKGNMYPFVTHTWNPIRGKCAHDCIYCYMKVWPQKTLYFDQESLSDNLGQGNIIFIGSSTDMFAEEVPITWILDTIDVCFKYNNWYIFQTKNPRRMNPICFPANTILATTIESNRDYKVSKAPGINKRIDDFLYVAMSFRHRTMISIEPILDFDLEEFVTILKEFPGLYLVSIGADSKGHNLPEPSREKTEMLIRRCKKIVKKVVLKDNLKRLL